MKKSLVALALAGLASGVANARDLEDILEEKGILTDVEANEGKAARERSAPAIPPLPDWLQKVTFSGDVRVRNESFFRKGDSDRVRQRFRLRLGAKAKLGSETELGLRLASGNPDDPISNNQSFDDTFDYKSINVTNAYLKLAPAGTFGWSRPYLTLIGGKFDVPTYHATRMMFDGDLAPEGFFESLRIVESASGA
ncbi:MAG: putative porin, partial [Candidatus Binatia bacterium]